MGNSYTTRDDLSARSAYRSASGTSFAYSSSMASTPVDQREVAPSVDPKKVELQGREVSANAWTRPGTRTPLPVQVSFDQTGSMGSAPRTLQEKLAALKGALLRAGLIDAQLCFGAYGDAQCDEVAPCQIGQYESGIEFEDQLNDLYLEGMGGGNNGETSGLLLYFLARHSRLDSLDKRGKKGYLILTGDENPLPLVTAREIKKYIGDDVQADLTIEQVIAEVTQSYDVYFFHLMTGSAKMQGSLANWQRLLGTDHVVPLESIDTVAEQMAMLIAKLEGVTDSYEEAAELLVAQGADSDAVRAAGKAMVRYSGAGHSGSPLRAAACPRQPAPSRLHPGL